MDYKNPIHKEYLLRREKLIEILKNLSILQNFDEESFFQTISYLDKCILKENFSTFLKEIKNNSDYSKMFLTGKNIDFDKIFLAILLGCFSLSSNFLIYFNFFLF